MKALGLLIVSMIAVFVALERRAIECGAGWVATMDLPYGIHADRVNGSFALLGWEDLIVLFPNSELQTTEGKEVVVSHIEQYAYDHNLYVEILAYDGEHYFVVIDNPNYLHGTLTAYSPREFVDITGIVQQGPTRWISVDYRSGFNNGVTLWRILCLLALAVLVRMAFKARRQRA